MLLSMVLAFGLTACGKDAGSDNAKDADSQQVSEKEDEGGFFDKLVNKKEDKEGYRENYYQVNAEYNSENPEKNKFTYASSTETFTMTGFRKIGNFYGGVAEAEKQDGELILIDKNGKEITQAGKYSWMDRIKDDKDYFEARDAETNLHGLIDKKGKVIVPFEYDNIKYRYGSNMMDFVIKAVKDDLMAVYTVEGKKIVDNISAENYEADYFAGPEGEYGIIYVYDYRTDSRDAKLYSEKTGEVLLEEGWYFYELYSEERFAKISNSSIGEMRLVFLNEDSTALIELAEGADDLRADATFIDDKWLLEGDYVHALYDEKGKQVFDFGMHTRAYQDEKGNTVFISKGEGKCIIRDKNCKEICTVENVEYGYSFGGGYFCGYPIVDGEVSREKNFYDMNGNLIYENIAGLTDGSGSYHSKAGNVVEDKAVIVDMLDGSKCIKTPEMKEFIQTTNEWTGYFMGYPTFETEEEIIICDKNLKEIARISNEARRDYTFGIYIEKVDGACKYYSCKGELLYEKEE